MVQQLLKNSLPSVAADLLPPGDAMTVAAAALAVALLAAPVGEDGYIRDVKPVLARRCASCHGVLMRKAGLRLDTAAAIVKGGDSGLAVELSSSSESLIVERITASDTRRMPPEGERLTAEEIAALRRWIDSGAIVPAHEPPPADPRSHWSFRSLAKGEAPANVDLIDTLLGEEHRRLGLNPRPRATKTELLRRVTIDLTGLVPTRDEVRAFVEDTSPTAYEQAVDRLLASPRFGERWARHWMDVWRYSDWDGFAAEIRESRPFLWHWRDWIVESLNANLSYDRMIVLMLAADEAEPTNASTQRATGFLARNWYRFNRNVWLDNAVEHTAKAFLGLTMNCARCHDHKYDPITQADYYRFRAFFEPHDIREDHLAINALAEKDGVPHAYDSKLTEPTYLFVRGDERNPDKTKSYGPGLPRFLSATPLPIEPVRVPLPSRRPSLLAGAKAALRAEEAKAVKLAADAFANSKPEDRPSAEIALSLAEVRQRALDARFLADGALAVEPPGPESKPLAMRAKRAEASVAARLAESGLATAQAKLAKLRRSEPSSPATAAAEAELSAAATALATAYAATTTIETSYTPAGPTYPSESTGRRLALARWIISPKNPLAARVAVNHVWAHHFGRPIVASTSDFGVNGTPPSAPKLLDALAGRFVDSGWNLKALHRSIVLSEAYRRDSSQSANDPNFASDPENVTLWRMNPRRMEAEVVRDNILFVSGALDGTVGGPDLDPELAMTSGRRSLYLRHAQEKRAAFLRVFDSPSTVECYRRIETVMPQQSLALANSPLGIASARRLASKLSETAGDDRAFLASAFEVVLNRPPTDPERTACEAFLKESVARFSSGKPLTPFDSGPDPSVPPSPDPAMRARQGLVHVLFNHTDFVTIR